MIQYRLSRLFYFISLVLATAAFGCSTMESKSAVSWFLHSTEKQSPITESSKNTDAVSHATLFQLDSWKQYSTIEVIHPQKNQADTLHYLLYPRQKKAPDVKSRNTVRIPVPLEKMIIFSTTHAAMLAELDAAGAVVGMGESEWVVNEVFRTRLERGKITALPGADNLAMEQIISLNPDAIMVIGQFANQSSRLQKLKDLGIPVIINADWLEQTPLGRAEWIRMIGRLVGKPHQADSLFNEIAEQYKRLNGLTNPSTINDKPKVLMNLSFKDQWYVPGGSSYMAALLHDAGADYPWQDTEETGGIPMSFEEIYQVGLTADIWLNPGAASTKKEILETDQRLKEFKPFTNDAIYNITKWRGEGGGYAFWERGVVHPEEILADLTKLLHPQLLPDHTLIYYEKLD